ncbi:MAG: DUF4190 domain-containing protein, partial [Planctomycetaceae bacterium]|nr:DUF4190 domain-containing protein [Planctomycetaceae bacterium]
LQEPTAMIRKPEKLPEIITDDEPLPARRRPKRTRREASPVSVEIYQERQASNSLGIAALVMGVIALITCWLPIVSIPVGGIGLILSGIGFVMAITRKGSGIGYAIAGGTLNGIGIVVPIMMLGFFGLFADAIDRAQEAQRRVEERNSRALTTNEDGETAGVDESDGEAAGSNETTDTTQQPNAEPASPWENASEIYDGDLVSVEIIDAIIGKVELSNLGDDSASQDNLLQFTVEVMNKQEAKKMNFSGWKGEAFSGRNAATLEDEHGNTYKRINFGFGTKIKGQVENDSIYPQKSVTDVLVFEVPVDAAKELRLKLPASAYGEEGLIYLVYDAGEVER